MIDAAQQRINALEKRVGPDAKSPLFAQLADCYLEISRAQDALRVCDAGLANFPFYTTGHLIKGKALVALNLQAEARREFEFILDFLPNNETIKALLSQMPQSESESISAALQETQPTTIEPSQEQQKPSGYGYTVSSTPSLKPSYEVGKTEQLAPEQEPSLSTEPSIESTFFDAVTQAPSTTTTDDAFGLGFSAPTTETPAAESSPFSGFDIPQPESPSFAEPLAPIAEQPKVFEFNLSSSEQVFSTQTKQSEEESFEDYAARRRAELSSDNTISLDDYFNNRTSVEPQASELVSSGVQSKIEELANKLQTAGKITPVINFAQKETPAASEQDTPAGMGFVTPTLAEIYAKQGWFDDAIKAYRTLARNKPAEKERYEKRIAELEDLKKQQQP